MLQLMAKSPGMKGENDLYELSDSEDTSAVDKLRHMIRRPDWFEVFKNQFEEQKTSQQQEHSMPEKPLDVSSSDTECISSTETQSSTPKRRRKRKSTTNAAERDVTYIPKPTVKEKQQRKTTRNTAGPDNTCIPEPAVQEKQKRRTTRNTAEPDTTCIPEPAVREKQKRRTTRKSSKSKSRPQRSRRNQQQNTQCIQTDASQNVDPDIVFLSDNEPEASACGAGDTATSGNAANTASGTPLDDSIEIISEVCKTINDKEIDFENREINILFCWQNKVLTLPMKQDTQFGTVLPGLLNKWEVHGANIMLLYQDKIIKVSDTPSDHTMFSGSIVECSVVKSKMSVDVSDPNVITIKLQRKNSRDKKHMAVNQMSQFQSIIERFAEEEGIPVDKVTFKFDGDVISPKDTPFSLGIENDYSIDVTY